MNGGAIHFAAFCQNDLIVKIDEAGNPSLPERKKEGVTCDLKRW
jgi:hypothetical protein